MMLRQVAPVAMMLRLGLHVHIEMKRQLALLVSTTTTHRLAPHAPVAMMLRQVAPVAMMLRQVAPVAMMLRLGLHVHIEMKHQLAPLGQNVTKFMHQSLDCLVRRQQLNA
jgi:hypothetical protein